MQKLSANFRALFAVAFFWGVTCFGQGTTVHVDPPASNVAPAVSYGSLAESSSSGQNCCCVCSNPSALEYPKGNHYCQKDFNAWLRTEWSRASASGGSFFIKAKCGPSGDSRYELKDSQSDWRSFLDNDLLEEIEGRETTLNKKTMGFAYFQSTLTWFTNSLYSLKTCSNVACCFCACPKYAEELALTKRVSHRQCFGDPYLERCPYCTQLFERLEGCPHMICKNPACQGEWRARKQVECPLCIATVGCSFPVLDWYCACKPGPPRAWDAVRSTGCWCVAPCEKFKCKTPCCFICPSEYVCSFAH